LAQGRWMRRLKVWAPASLLVLLTSCTAGSRVGVTTSTQGAGVSIDLIRCHRERVHRVELFVPVGDIVDDKDDIRLWKIVSEDGVELDSIVVGTTPSGFKELILLQRPLTSDERLGVTVETEVIAGIQFFRLRDLRPGVILFGDTNRSPDSFRRRALDGGGCGDTPPWVPPFIAIFLLIGLATWPSSVIIERYKKRRGVADSP